MTAPRRLGAEQAARLERTRAERGRDSLEFFLRAFVWPVVEPRTPYLTGWHIGAVCAHLEAVTAGDISRLVINVPPRTLKSTIGSVAWCPWEWLTRPETRWVYASYGAHLSTRDALKARRVVMSRRYQRAVELLAADHAGRGEWGVLADELEPLERQLGPLLDREQAGASVEWELAADANVKTKFETTLGGFRLSTSVGGIATGEGGDRIVADDPHNALEAESDRVREGVLEWWDGAMSTRLNDPKTGAMVIIMQRLHERDLSGHVLEQGGYVHLCLPMEHSPAHPYAWRGDRVHPAAVDRIRASGRRPELVDGDPRTLELELLHPDRLGPAEVAQLKRALGSTKAAGQLQQLPAPAEGRLFLRSWWRYYVTKEWADVHGCPDRAVVLNVAELDDVLESWDCAFKDEQAARGDPDYVVGQVWGVKGSYKYLLDQRRGKWSFTDTLKQVVELSARWPRAYLKLIEDKANGPAIINTLRGKVPGILGVEPEGGKFARAEAVAPMVEAGDVFLPHPATCPWVDEYVHELATFPNAANDDQVDATTQALNRLKGGSTKPSVGATLYE